MDATPPESAYAAQKIGDGYGYLRTRDGTLLSMTVKLPGPADKGPYPTVIEYSGYSPADPKSPQPSTLIASGLGYATVGINMRGTGCSGGAFDYFEQLQSTDGYDASRRSPRSRGSRTTRSGWSASRTRGSASSSSRSSDRRTSPRSLRCR